MKAAHAARIARRNLDFGMRGAVPVHWLGGDCHRTRFFDALSIMFPEGERAFIESVQHYRHAVRGNAQLAADVDAFIGQEALHSREHHRYNARLAAAGAPVDTLERQVAAQQDFARRHLSPAARLAFTACLEHFTAMIATQLLAQPRLLADADPRMARIWRWHAVEEIEHKHVAYDVLRSVVRPAPYRYVVRCLSMLCVSAVFSALIWRFVRALVRHDGKGRGLRGWVRLASMLFVSPGPLARIVPRWLAWFVPGFHPSWHRDPAALGTLQREYDGDVDRHAHD